ncbi:MAG: PIN domain-containing protein [Bryobacteraceae bacterium]|nr:PIN domain-containing protein [Bryobacteraceae bacterium]
MSGRFFLDTNLLIYAIDATDPHKQAVAQTWIATAHESGDGLVSYQVVQEWFNVVLRKAAAPLSVDEAASIYHRLIEPLWRIQSTRELLDTALDLHRRDSISWWDSLIVSAALQGRCERVLSDVLQDGRTIRGLKVHNPFRAVSPKRRSRI